MNEHKRGTSLSSDHSDKLADHIKFLNFTIAVFCVGIISLFASDQGASLDSNSELEFITQAAEAVSPAKIHMNVVTNLSLIHI